MKTFLVLFLLSNLSQANDIPAKYVVLNQSFQAQVQSHGKGLRPVTAAELDQTQKIENIPQTPTPTQVDNSLLSAFPPIGNQGAENSCVGWATTYYQYSYEYNISRHGSVTLARPEIFLPSGLTIWPMGVQIMELAFLWFTEYFKKQV